MRRFGLVVILIVVLVGIYFLPKQSKSPQESVSSLSPTPSPTSYPLQITAMRQVQYPGSDLTIEQTLPNGTNYHQYIASYLSQGLKINGLLTVPTGPKPDGGFPVIIFNHGYIQPDLYRTTERYVAYVAYFARSGYIVFKSDYRGHGDSQGNPEGGYYSPGYTADVLNALASIKRLKDPGESSGTSLLANASKIGMWGHSMGGSLTLRSLVVDPSDIKVAVIWGGVVGTYEDLAYNWRRSAPFVPSQRELALRNNLRQNLAEKYGSPSANSPFWQSIDPNFYLSDITAPIQLHAGSSDEEVPWEFSQELYDRLQKLNKTSEFYTYPNADHNISDPSFSLAMQRSLTFFDKYLK